ncbi:MAG: TetR/AcrR family transcriptional regulator [Luminiphilus sp.]|nr:TetR/AcrR family transcriptional regulator [Luminiphilus sp.]
MLAKKKKSSAKPAGPGELRRRKIFRSLHDCIEAEGYVNTSLQDVANRAEMSASHLCYYFSGKDAILLEYFESVSASILERVEALSKGAPREQINALADFWFRGKARSRKEIGIMLECFGVAVNHEALCQAKNRFGETCKSYLMMLFDGAPSVLGQNSRDAAEVCYALTIGLRSSVYFDKGVGLEDAHRIFLQTMLPMCGVSAEDRATARA